MTTELSTAVWPQDHTPIQEDPYGCDYYAGR